MREILMTIWEKSRLLSVGFFETMEVAWQAFGTFTQKLAVFCEAAYSLLLASTQRFTSTQLPLLIALAKRYPWAAGLAGGVLLAIFFFWLWMLWHAAKKEPERPRFWKLVVFFLGIFGATTYYFVRKRKLAKQTAESHRLEMSFFSATRKQNRF